MLSGSAPSIPTLAATYKSRSEHIHEPLKFLPVAFIVSIITLLYAIYLTQHLHPLLHDANPLRHAYGRHCFAAFHFATALLWICYARCILTNPGSLPDREEDPSWAVPLQDARVSAFGAAQHESVSILEAKRTGKRRNCKWCNQLKPDRCHHCRVCRKCVLKMDHHCPWIFNCVGFKNHKFFMLLIFYTAVTCNIITWTMKDSVREAISPVTPLSRLFFLLFGETLAAFLACLSTGFLAFHVWLMLRAMTTIEFCEKSMKVQNYDGSIFSRGLLGNVKAVLGDEPLLWLLPLSPPSGTGLDFGKSEASSLMAGKVSSTYTGGALRQRWAKALSSGGTGSAPDREEDHLQSGRGGSGGPVAADPFLPVHRPFGGAEPMAAVDGDDTDLL